MSLYFVRDSPTAASLRQFVEILDIRQHRAVVALDLRVGRFDEEEFVRGVLAATEAQTEVAGGEVQRSIRKGEAGLRACQPRPEHRIDADALEHPHLRLKQRGID